MLIYAQNYDVEALARKAASISQEWVLKSHCCLTEIAVLSDIPLYQEDSKEVMAAANRPDDGRCRGEGPQAP